MNKTEIRDAIHNCELDIASTVKAMADEIRSGAKTREDADKAVSELRNKKANLEKQLAAIEAPVYAKEEKRGWKVMVDGMKEKRAVTLSGTDDVFVAHDLKLAVQKKDEILQGVSYFYGKNASSVVPLFPANVAASFVTEGGTITASTATLSRKNLVLGQAVASLPVSQMTLDFSAAELESRLPEIFGNSMAALMCQEMLTGTGTNMAGIFTDSNISIHNASGEALTIAHLADLAVGIREKKYASPVIIMSPTIYGLFLADSSTDETTKIIKEELIRNKTVEGVKVIVSGYAPVTHATGDIVAVAGDLSNYAIALADNVKVIPKDTASSDITTFDGFSYFAGCPLISADWVGFKSN